MKRNRMIIIGAAIVAAVVVLTAPLWTPYFINQTVDEDFPSGFEDLPQEQQDVLMEMREENPEMAMDTAAAMMEDDTEADDEMPEMDEPVILAQGSFSFIDAVHNGEGTATIYELPDGSRVLRLEDFRVTNGPQLHVYLSQQAPDSIFGGVGKVLWISGA